MSKAGTWHIIEIFLERAHQADPQKFKGYIQRLQHKLQILREQVLFDEAFRCLRYKSHLIVWWLQDS